MFAGCLIIVVCIIWKNPSIVVLVMTEGGKFSKIRVFFLLDLVLEFELFLVDTCRVVPRYQTESQISLASHTPSFTQRLKGVTCMTKLSR